MKAVVLHQYGSPKELKYEDFPDPVIKDDEVLVRVSAVSINPVDYKMRSGEAKERFPVEFPGVIGRDVSGVVRAIGADVQDFAPGDEVFALANHTYAELCAVKASELAKIPSGLGVVEASALPLVLLTGDQLIRVGTRIQSGETVLVTGATGNVGRSAVRTAKMEGAKVIAGVRKKQLEAAKELGADDVIALDDKEAMAKLGFVDAVADTVGGETAEFLLTKVKQSGVFASVVGPPKTASMHPTIHVEAVKCVPDPQRLIVLANEVIAGRLKIPIDRMIALAEAGEGQAAAEDGGIGKILLLA